MIRPIDGDPLATHAPDPVAFRQGKSDEGVIEVVDLFEFAERRTRNWLVVVTAASSFLGITVELSTLWLFGSSTSHPDRAALAAGVATGVCTWGTMHWRPIASRVDRALDWLERRR